MLPFNYNFGLYRRNNFGQPCVWYARPFDHASIEVFHGIVGKTITREIIATKREPREEVSSRIKAKEKVGYKKLWDIKDNVSSPVEGELYDYLCLYLPEYRTTADGTLLPMLAKVYDNTNNKLFKKSSVYIGQSKINGIRCFVSAEVNSDDMFKPIKLVFQSREGTHWGSLDYLESYLLTAISGKLLIKMVEEHYILDGELYLPGYSVNEINHFIKDPTCIENKYIQYWCFDIAIDDTAQYKRIDFLKDYLIDYEKVFLNKEDHLNNKQQLVVIPYTRIYDDEEATMARDNYINIGFEGLILRNPDAEYQYGKRNLNMIKYKKSTDGKFIIVDIYPEGIKRNNIPLFLLKNDINDATFEVHIGGTQSYQESFLKEDIKQATIGKQMFVEYGERSGVNQVPFHVKRTYIL